MGMSASSYVAWGVDLGSYDGGHSCNEEKLEDIWKQADLLGGLVDQYSYGYEYSGDILGLNRQAYVNWGVAEFEPTAAEPPTADELAAFGRVLDYLEYTGDRTPKLLIWASYG